MALSEGLKGFVNFFTRSFGDTEEGGAFSFDDGYDDEGSYAGEGAMDGNAAIETLYRTSPTITRPERSFSKESKLATHPSAYKSSEVTVIEPRSFSESVQIVKKLLDNKTVVLHLDLLDKEQSQRTIDFVCGAAHALNGTAQKISDMVFIFTPSNVSLSVENGAVQNKFAESLWNKPL